MFFTKLIINRTMIGRRAHLAPDLEAGRRAGRLLLGPRGLSRKSV